MPFVGECKYFGIAPYGGSACTVSWGNNAELVGVTLVQHSSNIDTMSGNTIVCSLIYSAHTH